MDAPISVPVRRIAVLRALQLGDMLVAVPALRALRHAWPYARITLIGLPWAREFAARFRHYIDDFLVFPGAPGFPEASQAQGDGLPEEARAAAFVSEARGRRYDLAIQLHGSGPQSNAWLAGMGAAHLAGASVAGELPSGWPAGRSWVARWREDLPEIRRCTSVIESLLDRPIDNLGLELPASEEERRACARLLGAHGLGPRGYICLHAGARMLSRRWPLDRFAQVARGLRARGWPVVLSGAASEKPLAEALQRLAGDGLINLAGATDLGALAALVGQSALLVCNDTGISHVAAAMRTPSIVIACGSDAGRWAPLDRQRHQVLALELPCRPCMHQTCPIGHPCAWAIGADQVLRAALAKLPRKPGARTANPDPSQEEHLHAA